MHTKESVNVSVCCCPGMSRTATHKQVFVSFNTGHAEQMKPYVSVFGTRELRDTDAF